MPARRGPKHRYTVFVFRYASVEARERHRTGGIPDYQVTIVYMERSEALALREFGHACIRQTTDPLAYCVELERDHEVLARVKPLPHL